jgi:hypothetical protein
VTVIINICSFTIISYHCFWESTFFNIEFFQKGNEQPPGWSALKDSFMLGKSKLKDWDKKQVSCYILDEISIGCVVIVIVMTRAWFYVSWEGLNLPCLNSCHYFRKIAIWRIWKAVMMIVDEKRMELNDGVSFGFSLVLSGVSLRFSLVIFWKC